MNIQLVDGANGIIHPISLVGVTKQYSIHVDEGCQVDAFIRHMPLLSLFHGPSEYHNGMFEKLRRQIQIVTELPTFDLYILRAHIAE